MSSRKSSSKKSTKILSRIREKERTKDIALMRYDPKKIREFLNLKDETTTIDLLNRMQLAKNENDAKNVLQFALTIIPDAKKALVGSKGGRNVIYYIQRPQGHTVVYDISSNLMYLWDMKTIDVLPLTPEIISKYR